MWAIRKALTMRIVTRNGFDKWNRLPICPKVCYTWPSQFRGLASEAIKKPRRFESVDIGGTTIACDDATNITPSILSKIPLRLHQQANHPLHLLRSHIESYFTKHYQNNFKVVDSSLLNPAVSTHQNFDELLFPADHPGRNPTDTYFVNQKTVLRTHTSAHQSEMLRSKSANGYLLTADVYRRDEINASHYPVFHQMEGIRLFPRKGIEDAVKADSEAFASTTKGMVVEDTPTDSSSTNPIQSSHTAEEAALVGWHLKRSLEGMVRHIFTAGGLKGEDLSIRWIDGYFPFTSPSWEMEVLFQGKWLELCGCGVMQQDLLTNAGVTDKVGWAFGLGIERIAMVLYQIPDIRLFWSNDPRFLNQFSAQKNMRDMVFSPFSKYPSCYKDVSFWCPEQFHENEFCDVVREVAGDLAEDVALIDQFVHPKTKQLSRCFRIHYRSMDRNVKNEEIDEVQERVRQEAVARCGVTLR
ncbi:phenylalanyl-tRNA synthetase [Cladochytrium replicatum]|nr:phenylalanyl-tRNA synthetase [Cladochytrium replicatum]